MSVFFKFFAKKGKPYSMNPFENIHRVVQLESEEQRPCVKALGKVSEIDTMPVGSWFMETASNPYRGVILDDVILFQEYNEIPKNELLGILSGGMCNG